MRTSIVLATLNARYAHCAFGLRYLMANLGELQERARLKEFTINENPRDIVEAILALEPKIVGFGVYIWNTSQTEQVVSILKRLAPEVLVVLGGPEVSYESEGQRICALADYVVKGEGDIAFYHLCKDFLESGTLPAGKFVSQPLPEIRSIRLPYALYSDEDIRHRVIYVEASRGCPYKCEYCLSSLDKSVRSFELETFLGEMDRLIARGARQFKFVDRTFNLSVTTSSRILEFFLERIHLGLFLHFEMVPDRLPHELRELIRKFPSGSLQFEIGIQTWNPEVAKLVSRRQDYARIAENFEFLTTQTGVHLHADLIVGLPGETLESFAEGFEAVSSLRPHEIQVGLLKRLKGTPIVRHDGPWGMVYQEHPPFQILRNRSIDYMTLQKLARFSKFWDLFANSGNFRATWALIQSHAVLGVAPESAKAPRFWAFWRLSEFLSVRHPHGHSVALLSLLESAWMYLTQELGVDPAQARQALVADYTGNVKRDIPRFLKAHGEEPPRKEGDTRALATPKRQRRHGTDPELSSVLAQTI